MFAADAVAKNKIYMASLGTYYINAPTLIQATSVFTDTAMTIFAPDGWYSDGTTSRQLISGVLLVSQNCPSCVLDCDTQLQLNNPSIWSGYFNIPIETGTSTGAVVIEVYPIISVLGIKGEYNSVVYNVLSSNISGVASGNATDPTYIGNPANDCGISGSSYTLDEYNYSAGSFENIGTIGVTVDPTSVDLIGSQIFERFVMAIPKPTPSITTIDLTISMPCTSFSIPKWYIKVYCAAPLPSVEITSRVGSSAAACALSLFGTGYRVPSNSVYDSIIQLYDIMYSDANGENRLSSGFYKINHPTYDWMELDAYGIVIALGNC